MFKKKCSAVIALISGIVLLLSLIANTVYAITTVDYGDSAVQKALYTALWDCYTQGAFESNAGQLSEYGNGDSEYALNILKDKIMISNKEVYLPVNSTVKDYARNDYKISCKQLVFGSNTDFEGIFALSGHNNDNIATILNGLGYTPKNIQGSSGNNDRCKRIEYKIIDNKSGNWITHNTPNICIDVHTTGGQIKEYGKVTVSPDVDTCFYPQQYDCENLLYEIYVDEDDNIYAAPPQYPDLYNRDFLDDDFLILSKSEYKNGAIDNTEEKFWNILQNKLKGTELGYKKTEDYEYVASEIYNSSSGDTVYVKKNAALSVLAKDAVEYFSNGSYSSKTTLEFDDNEKLRYYIQAITKYFFNGKNVSDYWDCDINFDDMAQSAKWSNQQEIKINSQNEINETGKCYIRMGDAVNKSKIATFDGKYFNASINGAGKQDLKGVVDSINALVQNNPSAADGVVIDNKTQGSSSTSETDVCYSDSGALGWIICPVIYGLSGVGNKMWNEIEKNHMQISPGIFQYTSDGNGIKSGWEIMRNIANTIFIILFLIVIFSQLTGVGIDNYGIKKILPKLIVVAILVNLSYIICQIAVDLSNILGVSLNDLLSSGAGKVITEADGVKSASAGQLVTAGATLGAIFVVFGWFSGGGSILGTFAWVGMAVLGIVIVVVVAMLFLYLILIAREAGIIMAIVLAPVAIVCYALPNTEKFSKKWLTLFKSLLLVYPICGALIGAGKFAGAILAGSGGAGMKIAAMVVQVVPYFLVPLVLKNSLALMGNVGTKLSTLGRNLGRRGSRGATGAIRDSERYKNFQQYNKERRQARRAEAIRSRLQGRIDRGGTLSARNQNRLRQAQDIVLARNKRTREDAARSSGVHFNAMEAAMEDELRMQQSKERTTLAMNEYSGMGQDQMMARWNEIFDNQGGIYDGREEERLADLDALTNVITRRYGASGVNAIARQLGNKHNIAQNGTYQASMRSLQRTMNDNKDFAGFMRNKAPDAYQMISDGGMHYNKTTSNMEYADLSWFSENNKTATSIKDWATASSGTLARAVQYPDVLSDETIRSLLTSTDPAIQSGLQSESDKTNILKAALYNRQNPNSTLTGEAAAMEYDKLQAQQAQQAQNSEEAARRAAQAQAVKDALSNNVSEVRRYKPKIVGGNQRDITVRVMGDGRLLDENGNDVSGVDFDLYNRVD